MLLSTEEGELEIGLMRTVVWLLEQVICELTFHIQEWFSVLYVSP